MPIDCTIYNGCTLHLRCLLVRIVLTPGTRALPGVTVHGLFCSMGPCVRCHQALMPGASSVKPPAITIQSLLSSVSTSRGSYCSVEGERIKNPLWCSRNVIITKSFCGARSFCCHTSRTLQLAPHVSHGTSDRGSLKFSVPRFKLTISTATFPPGKGFAHSCGPYNGRAAMHNPVPALSWPIVVRLKLLTFGTFLFGQLPSFVKLAFGPP